MIPLYGSPLKKGDFFMKKNSINTRRLVLAALFAALAYVATLVLHIKVQFLSFDAKDTVICFAGMVLGPAYSVIIALIVSGIELITVSSTGIWGFIMNFVSSTAFALTASLFYHFFRKLWGAVTGLALSVFVQTGVMIVMNIIITPIYMGAPRDVVIGLIPSLLLPFNLLKSLLNASFVMALYKPLTTLLRRARLIPASSAGVELTSEEIKKSKVKTAVIIISGLLIACACIVIMILGMNGKFLLKK